MTISGNSRPRRAAVAAAIVATGLLGISAPVRADDFATVKAAAAKEGRLVVWHNTPNQETTDKLVAMFNKRFGMNIKVERVPVSGGRMTSRLMAEKRGGHISVDIFLANDRHLPNLIKNGLIAKVDWVGVFAGPGKIDTRLLKQAADNIIPAFRGYGLEFRHDIYGFAYNTKLLAEKDVPRTWEALADPKWRRKVAIDPGLTPIARLVPVIGRDAVLDLARRIVANSPVYADGQPAVATKVVTGETPLGALSLTSALDDIQRGAPVALAYPEPQAIVSQLLLYVTRDAPHPNLARLWAAWISSEAINTKPMIDEGVLKAWPGSPGPFGDYYTKHRLTVRHAMSAKELADANRIRKDLARIAAGGRH